MSDAPAPSTPPASLPASAPASLLAPLPARHPIWRRYVWFLVVMVACTAFDLVTKSWIFEALGVDEGTIAQAVTKSEERYEKRLEYYHSLPQSQRDEQPAPQMHIQFDRNYQHVVWQADPNVPASEGMSFSYTAVLNAGAFGGLLGGQILVLVLLSIVAVVIVAWILLRSDLFHYQVIGGLIIAGAFGNIYDRLRFGCVRDFLDFRWPELGISWLNPWNTFNFADSCIVVGIISLLVIEFFFPLPEFIEENKSAKETNAALSDGDSPAGIAPEKPGQEGDGGAKSDAGGSPSAPSAEPA